jgi:hypothetical protein
MNKSVAVYYASVPAKNTKTEKVLVLSNFATGIKPSGDTLIEEKSATFYPTDLAVIQGWVHEDSQSAPHLNFRRHVILEQRKAGKHTLAIDSNLFLYRDPGNTHSYLRFSLDDVFPTTGCYFNDQVNDIQWNKIRRDLGIELKPWTNDDGHILICLQRNGGWSMKGVDVMQWLHDTISTIRQVSKRRIVVRAHPGDRRAKDYLQLNLSKVWISGNPSILDDLKNAWATVTYNSSPGVASAIEGVPVFVTDPNPKNSQAYDVANTSLYDIESPQYPDREQWIRKISMSHFSFNDLASGEAWKVIKEYL